MLKYLTYLSISFFLSAVSYSQNQISVIDRQGIEKIISQRSGKTLLINIWATWCVPCREEFPDLIQLNRKYKSDVDIIGISVDYPDEIDSKIKPFAEKMNVNFSIYISDIKDAEEFINLFDSEWNGAIPATFLFNSNGKIMIKIYGKVDFEYFEDAINHASNVTKQN